ncbi:hypothetical protein [Taibaiella helva]|uniref:hypothetical protein n=1 Tax=Taibaiella helva TaxID=2301235 RepID=UPI000E584F25|nr:hypothetical protein [Taibaiella helva]
MPNYRTLLFLLLPALYPVVLPAQNNSKDYPLDAHFTGSLSAGPNFYFNNIKTFGDHVKPFNYSFFGRIMWNSRYLVSLGIETGYNKFYRVNGYENDAIRASLAAIPLHLVIGMRITKSVYTHFSFGPSLLLNAASSETLENHVLNKVFSLADGSFCVGYRRHLKKGLNLGLELKLNFSTKATDLNLALPVVLSYDF